jgi:hypothetical protein
MLKSVRVPPELEPPFARAEKFVEQLFDDFQRRPQEGTLHVGGDRYVLVRAQSLYAGFFDALAESFGEEVARGFIYNTAREIGRSDSRTFSERLKLTDGVDRLASGPVHFAHSGWALVDILPDSRPAMDESYYLHYYHPNTFESDVLHALGRRLSLCGCLFSAGYSAGWCSDAFRVDVHGREIRCLSRGDKNCEFIMAPSNRLDEHEARLLSTQAQGQAQANEDQKAE